MFVDAADGNLFALRHGDRSSVLSLTGAGRCRLDAAQGPFEDALEARLGAALIPERLDALASAVRDVRQHVADHAGT